MKYFSKSTVLGLTLGVLLAGYAVFAFTPPAAAPPGGNAEAPLNVGDGFQEKEGDLWVRSLGTTGGATFGGDVSWSGSLLGGSVPWGRIPDVPADLADGDQVGITSESDPHVGVVTSGQWCRGDGSKVQCNQAPPGGGGVVGPSDNLIQSADAERHTTSTTPVRLKEIVATWSGTYRIKFDLTRTDPGLVAHAQVYRNGIPVGIDQSTTSLGFYVTFTQDISGWSPGDLMQVYAWVSVAIPEGDSFVRFFRINGHMMPTAGAVNLD